MKEQKIGQKIKQTIDRHKNMLCRVIDLKIQTNKLNKAQKTCLNMYFLEAKWIFNNALNLSNTGECDIFSYNYKEHLIINKKDKNNQNISYKIQYLPAQCHQELLRYMRIDIQNLSKKKKKGLKVGKLKFRSEYNSIDLRQYKTSYELFKNKIRICGIKGKIRVKGLEQITSDMELANAKLVKLPDGFHLKVTTFTNKYSAKRKDYVGLDFGIHTTITTSDGKKYDKIFIEETESIKKLQRKILRNPNKNSNNKYKNRMKLQKQFQKLTNQKRDKANKISADLLKHYDNIIMQDELIKLWHKGLFGKTVQHSCLGLIKNKLRQSKRAYFIPSSFPSTKTCYHCGHKINISLHERQYICPKCGLSEDRDIKSAKSILFEGLNQIGVERIELTPLENPSATSGIIYHKQEGSMNWEALNL